MQAAIIVAQSVLRLVGATFVNKRGLPGTIGTINVCTICLHTPACSQASGPVLMVIRSQGPVGPGDMNFCIQSSAAIPISGISPCFFEFSSITFPDNAVSEADV